MISALGRCGEREDQEFKITHNTWLLTVSKDKTVCGGEVREKGSKMKMAREP